MNEQLKFSWGHIIAFLALVFIAYTTFVGATYYSCGNFCIATVTSIVVVVVLFVIFIGAQMGKATSVKFSKRIWIERLFVFSSPVVFIICMMPFYHFGVVHSQEDEIIGTFNETINASRRMFTDYEEYSINRIANYNALLDSVIGRGSNQSASRMVHIEKPNMVETLRLQLLSDNFSSLKTSAEQWIDKSSEGASTWNVFLLGNTREIKTAIRDWNGQLEKFSEHKMNNEELEGGEKVQTFSEAKETMDSIDVGFNTLTAKYTEPSFPPLWAIVVSVLLYCALALPYLIQDRHTKSTYTLCGRRYVSKNVGINIDVSWINSDSHASKPKGGDSAKDDDEFAPFTL